MHGLHARAFPPFVYISHTTSMHTRRSGLGFISLEEGLRSCAELIAG
jgi:hypothetical protein